MIKANCTIGLGKNNEISNLMSLWNEIPELFSSDESFKKLFMETFENLVVLLSGFAYTPQLLKSYKILYIKFQKIVLNEKPIPYQILFIKLRVIRENFYSTGSSIIFTLNFYL